MDIQPRPDLMALAKNRAAKYQIDPILVCAVIEQESGWWPWAVRYEPAFLAKYISPMILAKKIDTTEAYERAMSWGLMQVMGEVARELGFTGKYLSELCDPEWGIEMGCERLSKALARVDGNVAAALLGYNGGSNPNYAVEVMARMAHYQ